MRALDEIEVGHSLRFSFADWGVFAAVEESAVVRWFPGQGLVLEEVLHAVGNGRITLALRSVHPKLHTATSRLTCRGWVGKVRS